MVTLGVDKSFDLVEASGKTPGFVMGGKDEGEKRFAHGYRFAGSLIRKVGVDGLEPSASASQTQRASQLRYTPARLDYIVSAAKWSSKSFSGSGEL